nr:MAG: hypothetical protein 2 [Leviviridae sp.]
MFADPQSLTIGGSATSFVKQGSPAPDKLGIYTDATGVYELAVRQNKTSNRFRREVRLTKKIVAADPVSAINKEQSASVMIVIDEPRWGFSDAVLAEMSAALVTWYTASSYAKQTQLLQGES